MRIARELFFESLTLAIGGMLELGLRTRHFACWLPAPVNLPRLDEISIDPQVLLFTIGISLMAGLLFGLVPVFRYAGPRAQGSLREGGRIQRWPRTSPDAEHTSGRASCAGSCPPGRFGTDDSNFSGTETRPAGIQQPEEI